MHHQIAHGRALLLVHGASAHHLRNLIPAYAQRTCSARAPACTRSRTVRTRHSRGPHGLAHLRSQDGSLRSTSPASAPGSSRRSSFTTSTMPSASRNLRGRLRLSRPGRARFALGMCLRKSAIPPCPSLPPLNTSVWQPARLCCQRRCRMSRHGFACMQVHPRSGALQAPLPVWQQPWGLGRGSRPAARARLGCSEMSSCMMRSSKPRMAATALTSATTSSTSWRGAHPGLSTLHRVRHTWVWALLSVPRRAAPRRGRRASDMAHTSDQKARASATPSPCRWPRAPGRPQQERLVPALNQAPRPPQPRARAASRS